VNQENQSNNAAAAQSVKVYDELRDNETIQRDTSMQPNKSMLRSIVDSARVRENIHEPGPWSNVSKNEKKKGHLFDNTSRHELGFSIMEDTEVKPKFTPIPILVDNFKRGLQIPSNFVRKNKPQTDWQLASIYINPDDQETNSKFVKIPCYDKFMLYPKPNMEFSPEELRGYRWFKKHNIKNMTTKLGDSIWAENFDCGVRLPLDFVSKNLPQKNDLVMSDFNIEKGQNFSFRIADVYPKDSHEEYSFEELMMKKKWQTGLIKS
jgi:checkpoint serine/threonine-protein kinase